MNTVMLVDDNLGMRRLMRFLLEFEGYRVVVTDIYEDILPLLLDLVRPNDVIMTVGAGNIHEIGEDLLDKL